MNSVAKKEVEIIRSLPLFQVLSEEELERLAAMTEMRVIPKQSHIYCMGDSSDKLFILTKGVVKIGTESDEDREVIKQILHPVAVFGELGLVGEQERQDFAVAMNEEVHLLCLPVDQFQEFMLHNHQLSIQLLQWIGTRLRRTETRLESLIFKDARERIIDFLKDSARKRGKRIGYETLIRHSLTQQDIANITGTSRQTVTSVLNDLRKSNLIYFNRRSILIRDMTKLS